MTGLIEKTETETASLQGPFHSVELQAVRGLAALIVLVFHTMHFYKIDSFKQTVLDIAFNSSASVIMFFVLSGFVLTQSLIKSTISRRAVARFYLKRLFRIYPALWIACIVALIYELVSRHYVSFGCISDWWLSQHHPNGLSRKLLIESFLGKTTELTLPVWTLFIELIGSLFMPFIVALSSFSLMYVLVFCCFGICVNIIFGSSLYELPLFLSAFTLGTLAFIFAPKIAKVFNSDFTARLFATIMLLGLWTSRYGLGLQDENPYSVIGVLLASCFAGCLVAILYTRPSAFAILRRRTLAWLGDVSYSFYLLHMPLMGFLGLLLTRLFNYCQFKGGISLAISLSIGTVILTSIVATAVYRYVELPAVQIGKRISSNLLKRS